MQNMTPIQRANAELEKARAQHATKENAVTKTQAAFDASPSDGNADSLDNAQAELRKSALFIERATRLLEQARAEEKTAERQALEAERATLNEDVRGSGMDAVVAAFVSEYVPMLEARFKIEWRIAEEVKRLHAKAHRILQIDRELCPDVEHQWVRNDAITSFGARVQREAVDQLKKKLQLDMAADQHGGFKDEYNAFLRAVG